MRTKCLAFYTILAAAVPYSASAQGVPQPPAARTIEVTGHGDASTKPDLMTVAFSVDSEGKTADDCTRAQSEKTSQVVNALKSQTGQEAKIETSDFALNQQFGYTTPGAAAPPAPASTWKFNGQVNVRYPTLDDIGEFIAAGLTAGASGVSQSGFEEIGPGEVNQNQSRVGAFVNSATSGGSVPYPTKRMAFVWLTIQADGSTPEEAMRRGAALSRKVETAIKEKMHGQGSVEISEFQIQQDTRNAVQPVYQPPQQQQVVGYSAHTTISVDTRDLDALGKIIEAAMNAGAGRLNQVTFTISEASEARKQAIEKAADDAKDKAAALAKSMGVKLGAILRLTTNAQPRPQVVYGDAFRRASLAAGVAVAAKLPVLPREVGCSADVTAVYQID